MYKDVLQSIEGIGIYAVISLIIFVLFFTTVFLWVFRIRKPHAEHMGSMPLHDGAEPTTESGEPRHG
jgi:cbb3-type cytochrome oxidase subunit 3